MTEHRGESRDALRAELAEVGLERFTASNYRTGDVTHLVLFRFADAVPGGTKDQVLARFLALARSERDGRQYIRSILGGFQLSGEVSDDAFEAGFVVTFESIGDRNYYVGEPIVDDPAYLDQEHAEFKRFVVPLLATERGAEILDFLPAPATSF